MAKKDEREIKLWTCDTETRGLFGDVFRVGLYDGEEYHAYYNFTDAMEEIKKFPDYQNHVYIHNLDFDVAKVAPDIFNQSNIIFADSIFINNSAATVATKDFILHDSYKLLTASLEKLCKDFDLQELSKKDLTEHLKETGYKDKEDYFNRVSPDEPMLNEYLEYDCISLFTLLQRVMDICEIERDVLIKCPTAASLAMMVYRTRYNDHYKEATVYKFGGTWGRFLEDFIRLAYYGGRTEVFKPYIENGLHFDVNSLYPYVMREYDYPCGFPNYYEGMDAARYFDMWKRRKKGAGFLYADIFVPNMHIPPLPKRDKAGKLLFPVGKLTGVWAFPEVEKAVQLGCVIENVHAGVYYKETKPLFKEFVTHFEAVKTNSTGAKRSLAKLLQNSLYGKFGMNRARRTFVDMDMMEKLKAEETPFMVHEYNYNLRGIRFIETVTESKAIYIQPQIAAYVTAYARLELLNGLLMQQQAGEVAYCDTDSIAATAELPPEMVDDKAYGKWKLESVIEAGVFLQPKLYAEKHGDDETIRAKGIPKEKMKDLNFHTYLNWYEIIKAQEQETISIFSNCKARMKFITMLKNNMDLNAVNLVSKSIHIMAMQKRQMDYRGNSTAPHVIEEYGDVLADTFIYQTKYTKLLQDMDDDADSLAELVKEFGLIAPPGKENDYYRLYQSLPRKAKYTYFSPAGQPLEQWCEIAKWKPQDLLMDMKYTEE